MTDEELASLAISEILTEDELQIYNDPDATKEELREIIKGFALQLYAEGEGE
jgi:hypothetical protein